MDMIPGAGKAMKGLQVDDDAFVHTEAIIQSMTRQERVNPQILNGSRRRRIAKGSGCSIQEVNRLVKQFGMMRKDDETDDEDGEAGPRRACALSGLRRRVSGMESAADRNRG